MYENRLTVINFWPKGTRRTLGVLSTLTRNSVSEDFIAHMHQVRTKTVGCFSDGCILNSCSDFRDNVQADRPLRFPGSQVGLSGCWVFLCWAWVRLSLPETWQTATDCDYKAGNIHLVETKSWELATHQPGKWTHASKHLIASRSPEGPLPGKTSEQPPPHLPSHMGLFLCWILFLHVCWALRTQLCWEWHSRGRCLQPSPSSKSITPSSSPWLLPQAVPCSVPSLGPSWSGSIPCHALSILLDLWFSKCKFSVFKSKY